ncbi:MAG: hypothetical protein LBL93_07460, partial [Ruminococcus sp.]|nr:hypothetical protein [Ruminococcus sp.]
MKKHLCFFALPQVKTNTVSKISAYNRKIENCEVRFFHLHGVQVNDEVKLIIITRRNFVETFMFLRFTAGKDEHS